MSAVIDRSKPFLQLRWEESALGHGKWVCHYELILPLDYHDIRREVYNENGDLAHEMDHKVIHINSTERESTGIPCANRESNTWEADTPFRDGAHAKWDSRKLGIPAYVIAPNGMEFPLEAEGA